MKNTVWNDVSFDYPESQHTYCQQCGDRLECYIKNRHPGLNLNGAKNKELTVQVAVKVRSEALHPVLPFQSFDLLLYLLIEGLLQKSEALNEGFKLIERFLIV